jgi:hypothetical protein
MGKKMIGQKDGQYFFPQNCLLLKRGTDVAIAGISEHSLAAGR